VIDEDGSQLGIMPPSQALMLAEERGLDLVEIAATASPPVCRIMNSGKFFYQQSKRESEARKHQRHIQVKEVKFRPKIDEHDFQFKRRNVERFLSGGNKVKSVVIFRGREVVHMEVGRRHLERLAEELGELCNVESPPKKEGNTMVQILAPKKDTAAKKAAEGKKAAAKKPESGKKSRAEKKAAKKTAPAAEKPAEAKKTETVKKGGKAKAKKAPAKKEAPASTRTRKTAGQPEAQEQAGRGEALQADRFRQGQAPQVDEAAHPDEEGAGAQARPEEVDARLRFRGGPGTDDAPGLSPDPGGRQRPAPRSREGRQNPKR
jgi:translation initiation factor IF-3